MAKGNAKNDKTISTIAYWSHRARGIGLLLGFAITFWISRGEDLPLTDSVLRAVVGAFAMSLVCWWCALLVLQGVMRGAAARSHTAQAGGTARSRDTATPESNQ